MPTLGATNSDNSAGGDIIHNQTGFIGTAGDFSPGAIIQSIGGGGGSAQIIVGIAAGRTSARAPDAQAAGLELGAAVAAGPAVGDDGGLGAIGGTGNDGGAIDTGLLRRLPDRWRPQRRAWSMQSIGAGGGVNVVSGDDSPNITLGGKRRRRGHRAATSRRQRRQFPHPGQRLARGSGPAVDRRRRRRGVRRLHQPRLTLNTDNGGDGGDIDFVQTGDINTLGDGAFGIIAQTLGGGGGFVDGFVRRQRRRRRNAGLDLLHHCRIGADRRRAAPTRS